MMKYEALYMIYEATYFSPLSIYPLLPPDQHRRDSTVASPLQPPAILFSSAEKTDPSFPSSLTCNSTSPPTAQLQHHLCLLPALPNHHHNPPSPFPTASIHQTSLECRFHPPLHLSPTCNLHTPPFHISSLTFLHHQTPSPLYTSSLQLFSQFHPPAANQHTTIPTAISTKPIDFRCSQGSKQRGGGEVVGDGAGDRTIGVAVTVDRRRVKKERGREERETKRYRQKITSTTGSGDGRPVTAGSG